jgi:hypothetical protein
MIQRPAGIAVEDAARMLDCTVRTSLARPQRAAKAQTKAKSLTDEFPCSAFFFGEPER